jgi:thiamine-monophosphate kinase
MLLKELGEGGLIKRIRERFKDSKALLGIGDDAAIVDLPAGHSIVYCSDLVAENTHFIRNLHPPESIGYKAVAVNVSDVGAMGGIPMHFVVSLALPDDVDLEWIDGFYDGIARACGDFEVSLVGGDSSSAERIFVDVSMIGRVRAGGGVRRSGAQVGDGIYVTGQLGASIEGLEQLRKGALKSATAQRHLFPQPRHRIGAEVSESAHAMIDISDGLSTDLTHIVKESRVSARIYKDKIPTAAGVTDAQAIHGGEEYELIITAVELPETIHGVQLTRIGEIIPTASFTTSDHQVFLVDGPRESVLRPQGWQHF